MVKNVETRGNSHWRRKAVAIISLPIVISLWMLGWTLAQIGPQRGSMKIKQKMGSSHPKLEAHKRSKTSENEDSRIANMPEIIS